LIEGHVLLFFLIPSKRIELTEMK